MQTPSHGFWVYLLARKHREAWWAGLGAMMPDAIGYLFILWYIYVLNNKSVHGLGGFLVERGGLKEAVGLVTHSFIFATLLLIIFWLTKSKKMRFFGLGYMAHLIMDFFTHGSYSWRMFWPLSNYVFNSPLSYWNKEEFGDIFTYVDSLLTIFLVVFFAKNIFRNLPNKRWLWLICVLLIVFHVFILSLYLGDADLLKEMQRGVL